MLDDYHLLEHDGVHESVEFFLAYLPAALRVVIAGRSDPPLPLARLRARGELTELRAADLGFSRDGSGRAAQPPSVTRRSTDGGRRALGTDRGLGGRAAARRADDPRRGAAAEAAAPASAATSGTSSTTSPPRSSTGCAADQRDLLVRTAVLERLSGPLCDAVLGRSGSAASSTSSTAPTCS